MEVYIDKLVHQKIEQFYDIAMELHESLDFVTILKKEQRLYDALASLGRYAKIYSLARYNNEWRRKGYKEFICEDFHFAYQIYTLDDGEEIVRIHDAVHSLLNYNPEDK